jgi:phosphoribosylformimino-5-aminoimidazole carboxamide ribotide isomerase
MQIIPAIDIINGKCVRLTEGDYTRMTEYTSSPLELAKMYEANGIERLHLVDLDGAKAGAVQNWQVAEEISSQTKLIVDFGGGVKTKEDVHRIIDLGISYVTVGSIAVKNQDAFLDWILEFGANRFLLGADVRDELIMVSGWTEKSTLSLIPFLEKYCEQGISSVFCTDVSKDGKLEGPSVELYKKIITHFSEMKLIASGGVSSMIDLDTLAEIGCSGVIIGKAIYEHKISIKELTDFIIKTGKN